MEQVERKEFPGNDASWYRALLADTNGDAAAVSELSIAPETTTADASEPDTEAATAVVSSAAAESAQEITDDHPSINAEAAVDTELPVDDDPSGEVATVAEDAEEDATEDTGEDSAVPMITAVPTDDAAVEDKPLDNTSEMVGQLWTADEKAGPLDTWEPDDMNRKITSPRSFRWTSIVGALAIIGLIVVGLVLLPSIARGRADDHMDMYSTVLGDLRGELPDTQRSLEIATDPASEVADLDELNTQLTVLAAKASAVDLAAQTELPASPPFTSSGPIDELEPIRQQIEPLGTVASSIQRRIANLVEYRTLMDGFLALPELPDSADSATQAELRVTLAAAQAESASILADLPTDAALESHRELARDTNERFATWQVEYLESLRTEDVDEARALLTELDNALVALDSALVTPLAQIRRETDAAIIDLARSIDNVLAEINGSSE